MRCPTVDSIILEDVGDKTTKSGLILTAGETIQRQEGRVVMIGAEVADVEVGDVIMYMRHVSKDFFFEGKKYKKILERHVYCKILEARVTGQKMILPVPKRILVKLEDETKVGSGAIVIPQTSQKEVQAAAGEVIAIGIEVSAQIQLGEQVVLTPGHGAATDDLIVWDGARYCIVLETDVLAFWVGDTLTPTRHIFGGREQGWHISQLVDDEERVGSIILQNGQKQNKRLMRAKFVSSQDFAIGDILYISHYYEYSVYNREKYKYDTYAITHDDDVWYGEAK